MAQALRQQLRSGGSGTPQRACSSRFSGSRLLRPSLRRHLHHHQPHTTHHRTARLPAAAAAAAAAGALEGTLLLSSALPVVKIGVVASAGAFAARYGMLNVPARRALSELAINVFTPALMLSKLGAHIDLASALSLWFIGANVILCHLVGLGLGLLHTRLLATPPSLRPIVHVSSCIANTGNLPLVLVLSLIKSPDLPFNNAAAQADAAVSYIMLGLWFATLVQMPLGTLLLHKPAAQGSTPAGNTLSSMHGQTPPPQQLLQQARLASAAGSHKQHHHHHQQQPARTQPPAAGTVLLERPPVTAAANSWAPLELQLQDRPAVHQREQQQQQQQPTTAGTGWRQQWAVARGPLARGALSAPVIAGIVAISIGSCPPLQAALFTQRGALSWVGDVLDMLGQPLVPVLLLVLGANLSNGPQLASGGHLPMRTVAGVICSKLLLSPLLGLAVVLGAQRAGLLGPAGGDPLAALVMAVVWATPTAVLVHSLALVHSNGEDEVSALLFYEYLAAALTLPLCSAVYLSVLGCGANVA